MNASGGGNPIQGREGIRFRGGRQSPLRLYIVKKCPVVKSISIISNKFWIVLYHSREQKY